MNQGTIGCFVYQIKVLISNKGFRVGSRDVLGLSSRNGYHWTCFIIRSQVSTGHYRGKWCKMAPLGNMCPPPIEI